VDGFSLVITGRFVTRSESPSPSPHDKQTNLYKFLAEYRRQPFNWKCGKTIIHLLPLHGFRGRRKHWLAVTPAEDKILDCYDLPCSLDMMMMMKQL
jgi:hypothetical protein